MTSYPKNEQFTNLKINSEQDLFEINPINPLLTGKTDSEILNLLCEMENNNTCNPFDIYKINNCDKVLAALKVNGSVDICKGLKIGYTDARISGAIRFHHGHFEGFNGEEWIKLDCCPTSVECARFISDECPDGNTIVNTNHNSDYVSVDANNGFLVKAFNQSSAGTLATANAAGASGAGVRMMFIPGLSGAFRSGHVTGSQWNMTNIGPASAAFGVNTEATGDGSFAMGYVNNSGQILASGIGSFAIGGASGSSGASGPLIIADANGSMVGGYINKVGVISVDNNSYGGNAQGFASDGQIKVTSNSFGANAQGCVEFSGEILVLNSSQGANAQGYAFQSGKILINDYSLGSNAQGAAFDYGKISIDNNSFGANAQGYASGNGLISIDFSSSGGNAQGYALDFGQILINSNSYGANAQGYAESYGQIVSSGQGSFSRGWAGASGIVSATSFGSFASGYASEQNSLINASQLGSHAMGFAYNSGQILASQMGSFALGIADSGIIKSNGYGSLSMGVAQTGGLILSENNGSFAMGNVHDSGQILSSGVDSNGAMARGYAHDNGIIISTNRGSFSNGYARYGTIESKGFGSIAAGSVEGMTGSLIRAQATGSFANGWAFQSGQIIAKQTGSMAFGIAISDGELIESSGYASFAFGRDVSTSNNYSLILGRYGIGITGGVTGTSGITGPSALNENMIYGEGSLQIAGGGGTGSRDISVIIGTSSFGSASVGGGIADFWHTSGADYAEYFEWNDGNENNEDRIGYFVKLVGEKIEIAKDSGDKVIGVVTSVNGTSGYIADNQEKHWYGAIQVDDFGRKMSRVSYINGIRDVINKWNIEKKNELLNILNERDDYEMINIILELDIVKNNKDYSKIKDELLNVNGLNMIILNPNYDPNKKYIPRRMRKEWTPVGMLGKIFVRDNGLCKVGEECDFKDGIAIPGTKWQVLRRQSANVIKILYK